MANRKRRGSLLTVDDVYRQPVGPASDLRWIQAMLGHASVESTQIYTQVSVRALQAVHASTHPAEREAHIRDDNTEDEHHNDNTTDTT